MRQVVRLVNLKSKEGGERNMRHRLHFQALALYLMALFSASSNLAAQTAAVNGQIEGTVTDASGGTVPNADVKITNSDTGFAQSAKTNDSGFYRFPLLPLGSYRVAVTSPGFAPYEQTGVTLSAGATATVNVSLGVSGSTQTVEVSSNAPVIDPARTDVGATLSGNAIANLPLVSRNPYNFILLQPNVAGRPNTEFGVPRKINANGFNGRINYQIDGSNNTESDRAGIRLLPFSDTFIQEVEMVNNGFAPEFGNTVGTVFNTITKSGTNELHGEGAYLFRRTDFSARPALLASNRPAPETNVDTFFGNVGGPIKENKVFYFAGVEHVKRDLPTIVSVSPGVISALSLPASYANAIPFSQSVLFFMGKIDYQINSNNRLSVRFNGHRNDSPYNNGGGLVVVSQTYNFIDRSYSGAFQLVSTLSPTLINELRVQVPYRLQRQVAFSATGTGPSITIPGTIQFGGSPNLDFLYKEVTPEATDAVRYSRGNHTYSVGFNFRGILDRQAASPSATYTFPSVAAYLTAANGVNPASYSNFNQAYGQPSLTYNSKFYGAYAQDNWKLRPNVTLIYGVRYELYGPPSGNRSVPYELSRSFHTDGNNFAPRLGLAIGLGKDQKTVIRASGGLFYDPPQTDVYRRALLNGGQVPPLTLNLSPASPVAPAFPAVFSSLPSGLTVPIQDVISVAPDFATLYSVNGNVSVSRQFGQNTGITATYLFTRGNRLPVYRNVNLLPNGQVLADGRPVFGSGHIDPRFNNISIAESVGQSIYNGATITLRHRVAYGLELFSSYTWSHAVDDAPEQNNIDSATQYPSDPTNRRRDRGNSLTDRRHSFALDGVYTPAIAKTSGVWNYIARNNQLSFQFVGYSGDIFNIGSNRVLNGDPTVVSSLQRPLFIGRNTYRGPATYQLDTRYTRLVPFGERVQGQFFAEFTNLLNHTNVTAVNTTATVNAAGAIVTAPSYAWNTALDQRLLQFGIRAVF
jgi:hypothetical protein